MSQLNTNAILDASGGTTTTVNGFTPTTSNMAGRNRIINGDMRIDQRNAGASVTSNASGVFCTDRWNTWEDTDGTATVQQSTTAPAGFVNSLLWTTGTADASLGATQYCMLQHRIEGNNIADLAWGTASAATVTLSFWVRSSLTGTFGGAFRNSAGDRSYPFTYTISAANTFEYKTITVAGDTTGTWLTNNNAGINVEFGLGVGSTYSGTAGAWAGALYLSATGATSVIGTAGATFYITGVQLEAGSVATPFEHRQYGQELALCQRYYVRYGDGNSFPFASAQCFTSTGAICIISLPQPMRATPAVAYSNLALWSAATAGLAVTNLTLNNITGNAVRLDATVDSGLVAGNASFLNSGGSSGNAQFSAEL